MKTDLQVLIETYGCKDLADLKRCFIDNAMSLSMIQDAMRAYREQGDKWVFDALPSKSKGYLATDGKIVFPAYYDEYVGWQYVVEGELNEPEVIAWKKYPSPPKQEATTQ